MLVLQANQMAFTTVLCVPLWYNGTQGIGYAHL